MREGRMHVDIIIIDQFRYLSWITPGGIKSILGYRRNPKFNEIEEVKFQVDAKKTPSLQL